MEPLPSPPVPIYTWDGCIKEELQNVAKRLSGPLNKDSKISRILYWSRKSKMFSAQWAGSWHSIADLKYFLDEFDKRQKKNKAYSFRTIRKWIDLAATYDGLAKRMRHGRLKVYAVLAVNKFNDKRFEDKALVLWLSGKFTQPQMVAEVGEKAVNDFLENPNIDSEELLEFEHLIPPDILATAFDDQNDMAAVLKMIEKNQKGVTVIRKLFGKRMKPNATDIVAFEKLRGRMEGSMSFFKSSSNVDYVNEIFEKEDLPTVLEKLNFILGTGVELDVFAEMLVLFRDKSYLEIGSPTVNTNRPERTLCMACAEPNSDLFCASCNISVHKSCVHESTSQVQVNWLCDRCHWSPDRVVTCFLCHQQNGGVFVRVYPKIWAHSICNSIWIHALETTNERPESLVKGKCCYYCDNSSGICCSDDDDGRKKFHPSCCARALGITIRVNNEDVDEDGVAQLESVSVSREKCKLHKLANDLKMDAIALEAEFGQNFEHSKAEFRVYLADGLIEQINQLLPINANRVFVEALWAIWKILPKRITRTQSVIGDGDVGSEEEWNDRLQELYPAQVDVPMQYDAGEQSFEMMASKPGPSSAK